MEIVEIKSALEAILFASGDAMDCDRIAKVLGISAFEMDLASEMLASDYSQRGIRLVRMENRLQIATAPEYNEYVNHALEKRTQQRLSAASLEVLTIIAYYQPVTRAYIEQLRGTDSSYTVALLTERGLITPAGKLDVPGRPTLFKTTDQFLRVIGIESLDELPKLPNVSSNEGIFELQEAIEKAAGLNGQMVISDF